jgi:mRNA interferase RelE/StbE
VKVFDVRKLEGYEGVYRIRAGDIRLVYSVDWDEKVITIHFIGLRKKAYK